MKSEGVKWTRARELAGTKARKARRQVDGDPDKARQLLWQWGQQDKALKDAIFRVGCEYLTMGPGAGRGIAGGTERI